MASIDSEILHTGDHIELKSLVDLHTHLRQPGGESMETIESGTRAGLAGGYQMLSDMPNNPAPYQTWTPERVKEKRRIIENSAHIDVGVYSGVDFSNPDIDVIPRLLPRVLGSKFYMGFTTNNSAELVLDDVRSYVDAWVEEGRERGVNKPIMLHAREGAGAETADYVARLGNKVHWCHVSTETEAAMAADLSKRHPGLFSAGVTPHHLTMTQRNATHQQGWNGARMMPPLGKEVDADALLYHYNDGSIQVLETDHAPHTAQAKRKAEVDNPTGEIGENCTTCFGISGIEFVLPIMVGLVRQRLTTLERVHDSLYEQPIRTLGLEHLKDTVLNATTTIEIDPYAIAETDIVGKSRNTPYVGWRAGARVMTVKRDRRVMYGDKAVGLPGEGRFIHQEMQEAA